MLPDPQAFFDLQFSFGFSHRLIRRPQREWTFR
jgi:hypothetical protein